MKAALRWMVRWARRAVRRDFYSALVALVSPVQNIFFPLRTIFHFMCPRRLCSNLGRQSCRVACLLICVSDRAL
jgi:hypothetical protein